MELFLGNANRPADVTLGAAHVIHPTAVTLVQEIRFEIAAAEVSFAARPQMRVTTSAHTAMWRRAITLAATFAPEHIAI